MPFFSVKGTVTSTVTDAHDKVNVEWKIPQFFTLQEYADDVWHSPSFLFLNAEWCLRITLNIDDPSTPWKGLGLVVRNLSSSDPVSFTLGIRRLAQPCKYGPVTRTFSVKNTVFGKKYMFVKSDLKRIDASEEFLLVYCHAAGSLFEARRTTLPNRNIALCRDFQDLLLSGRKSDLTIELLGQEFKAHKLILETRSPVFAAMFEHDMTEKKESAIKVEDCDPDTFQNFLQCIYGGRVETLSVDKIIPLYMVSHKYTVTDIMDECVHLLEFEMSVNTVLDILTLANTYDELVLKKSAEEFMAENMDKIFSTNSWNTLLDQNSLVKKYS